MLESVRFPGQHVGVRESGEAKKPNHTGRGKHGQFKVKVIKKQPEYHRVGTSLLEVCCTSTKYFPFNYTSTGKKFSYSVRAIL